MRERERRVARTVIASDRFLRAHAAAVPEVAALAQRLARHAERIEALWNTEGFASLHQVSAVARNLAHLKRTLREGHLKRIAKAGRKLMKKVPGVARAFSVPAGNAPAERLVASARAMLKAVHPARKLFHEAGFARNFEKSCADAAATLAHAAGESRTERRHGARLRREMADETSKGRALIEVIDAVLEPRCAADSIFATDWKAATRVGRRIGRPPQRRDPGEPPPTAQ